MYYQLVNGLPFWQTLKDFLIGAEAEVRSLTSLYSNVVCFSPCKQILFMPYSNLLRLFSVDSTSINELKMNKTC